MLSIGLRILVLFTSMIVTASAAAAGVPAETRWADPSRVRLNVEFPGDGYHASWELFRCECGDLLVRAELNIPDESVSGDLLLVKQAAVLSRGFGKYREEAAASLDAAALMMQLALRLLERSVPGGPAGAGEKLDIDVQDTINHIHLDTGTAVGGFRAPWSIAGEVAPAGETARRFDLRFSFSAGAPGEAQQASMRLSGQAEFADTEFPVPGNSRIDQWDLSWRDEEARMTGSPQTLEELRELIRAE